MPDAVVPHFSQRSAPPGLMDILWTQGRDTAHLYSYCAQVLGMSLSTLRDFDVYPGHWFWATRLTRLERAAYTWPRLSRQVVERDKKRNWRDFTRRVRDARIRACAYDTALWDQSPPVGAPLRGPASFHPRYFPVFEPPRSPVLSRNPRMAKPSDAASSTPPPPTESPAGYGPPPPSGRPPLQHVQPWEAWRVGEWRSPETAAEETLTARWGEQEAQSRRFAPYEGRYPQFPRGTVRFDARPPRAWGRRQFSEEEYEFQARGNRTRSPSPDGPQVYRRIFEYVELPDGSWWVEPLGPPDYEDYVDFTSHCSDSDS